MANNRLYIRDKATGDLFYLARSNAPAGWRLVCRPEDFDQWAAGRDLVAVEGDGTTQLDLTDDCAEDLDS